MGELGTLYENSPNLRDGGSWQVGYMYFLGLIIGGGTSQIQKNIISEVLECPKPKVQQEPRVFWIIRRSNFFQDNVKKFLSEQAPLDLIREIAEDKESKVKDELHQGIRNLGINNILIPEENGGLGLDLLLQ